MCDSKFIAVTMATAVWLLCVVFCATSGRVKGNTVKRSDDTSPLEAVVSKLASEVTSLQAQMTAKDAEIQQLKSQVANKVAFGAFIEEVNLAESLHGVIKFSGVFDNKGNAYDPHTGAFTAPHHGVFFFLVSVDVSPDYSSLTINRNGSPVTVGGNDNGHSAHIVASFVVALNSGDTVTVNHAGAVKGVVDGGRESVFVGFEL